VAARRLLIVMLVLLVTSTVAAALVPPPPEREETTSSTTSPSTSPIPTDGVLLKATLETDTTRPQRIELPLGDQLALRVLSRRAGQVEIRGLGLVEDVMPLSPARFDILATRAGTFEVRLLEPRRHIGTIVVSDKGAGARAPGDAQ
jgi:hypothetical protein